MKMTPRAYCLAAFAALLLLVKIASAQTWTVQQDGVTKFVSPCPPTPTLGGFEGGTYNYKSSCGVTPPPTCAADPQRTRLTSMTVGYAVGNVGNLTVDATQFQPTFGRASVTDPPPYPIPFGGVSGTGPNMHLQLAAGKYLAMAFPSEADALRYAGSLTFQSNNSRGCTNHNGTPGPCGQPYMDVSISRQCNDYNPATALHVQLHMPSDGATHFNVSQGFPPSSCGSIWACLQPSTPYFLNIRFNDPTDFWRTVYVIWYWGVAADQAAAVPPVVTKANAATALKPTAAQTKAKAPTSGIR